MRAKDTVMNRKIYQDKSKISILSDSSAYIKVSLFGIAGGHYIETRGVTIWNDGGSLFRGVTIRRFDCMLRK